MTWLGEEGVPGRERERDGKQVTGVPDAAERLAVGGGCAGMWARTGHAQKVNFKQRTRVGERATWGSGPSTPREVCGRATLNEPQPV